MQPTQPAPQPQLAAGRFESVDFVKDAATWTKIASAFRQELLPDQPTSDPNANVYTSKHITRIWRYGDAALVVLEKRTNEKEKEEWNRPFELYNFNLATNAKSPITAKWTFWRWRFSQLARFDDGPIPDITFETASCTACEPLMILSALRLDPQKQAWELRFWPKGEEGLAVADAAVGVDESVEEYETVSGIGDFQGKGHDEVGIWTHFRNVNETDPKKILPAVTTLSLYGFQNGNSMETEVKDPSEIARFKKILCKMNRQPDACTAKRKFVQREIGGKVAE